MREIPLAAVPGQIFTVTEGSDRIRLVLKEARGVVCCDISVGGVEVVTGSRVLAGEMLIPYPYREAAGNFIMQTVGGALPDWREFGVSQALYFLTPADLEAIRADN